MTSDTSEKGLETGDHATMTGVDGLMFAGEGASGETPDALTAQKAAGSGWIAGDPRLKTDRSKLRGISKRLFEQLIKPELTCGEVPVFLIQ